MRCCVVLPVVLSHCPIGFVLGCICIEPAAPGAVGLTQQHPPYKPNGVTRQHDGTVRGWLLRRWECVPSLRVPGPGAPLTLKWEEGSEVPSLTKPSLDGPKCTGPMLVTAVWGAPVDTTVTRTRSSAQGNCSAKSLAALVMSSILPC